MKPINAFKRWLLITFVPYMEVMPYIDGTKKKEKDLSKEQRFRDLFKKRKSALIVVALVLCVTVFGIGKSFSVITALIACSPIVVIFWSSFGELIMGIFKFKNNKR
tara:strand:+ start:260 stop:577 length:318 start_codon:yes stop_codon:yes gene_type:complete